MSKLRLGSLKTLEDDHRWSLWDQLNACKPLPKRCDAALDAVLNSLYRIKRKRGPRPELEAWIREDYVPKFMRMLKRLRE